MKCIIPAAGFGTRMGMKIDESKELLIDPETNAPIIQYSLDLCNKYNLEPVVVTRAEKRDLIDYCDRQHVLTQIIVPEGEWMNTVLMSSNYWDRDNILILPDTRFNPTDVILEMKKDLELGARTSIALHKVPDADKWCIVRSYTLMEKPKCYPGEQYAFGLIAFTKAEGRAIFTELKDSKVALPYNSSFRYLENFKDITRDS